MANAESHRNWVTTSIARGEKKRQELRIAVLKNNLMKRFKSEEAASYSNKNNCVAGSTVAPYWVRDADKGLRALILSQSAYRNSRAGSNSRVMTPKQRPHKEYHYSTMEETGVTVNSSRDVSGRAVNTRMSGYDSEHNGITSEVMFQTRQKRFKPDYSFKETVFSGNKVTLIRNGRVDSNNNGGTLTGPVRVGHTQNIW
jgi:hypothetical protein